MARKKKKATGKIKKVKKKTRKWISSRVTKKKSGTLEMRKPGKNHFNARESGKKTRNKRNDITVSKSDERNIKSAIQ